VRFVLFSVVCVVFLSSSFKNNSVSGCRFDPKNMHQCPQVVVLCGRGSQAAFAVNCARHLASRHIHLTVFLPSSARSDGMEVELKLLELGADKPTTLDYKSRFLYCIIQTEHMEITTSIYVQA